MASRARARRRIELRRIMLHGPGGSLPIALYAEIPGVRLTMAKFLDCVRERFPSKDSKIGVSRIMLNHTCVFAVGQVVYAAMFAGYMYQC